MSESNHLKDIDKYMEDQRKKMEAKGVPTEQEMRAEIVPWFESVEDLSKYINQLVERPHDYGTCAYAMSMAAVAAFQYVARKLGATGFQASCADLDIIRRTRRYEFFIICNLGDLLFPQYCTNEHFSSARELLVKHAETLAKLAEEKLKSSSQGSHPDVVQHWKNLANQKYKDPTVRIP